jgi:cobalt/nickel transport system permease protein
MAAGGILHYHTDSPIHRAPAHVKVLVLVGFMLVVVATPKTWYPAYGAYLLALVGVAIAARVPARHLMTRLVVEVPFVVFAVLVPFVARGPRLTVLGLSLSESGLVDGAAILVRSTLGVLAGVLLASTTGARQLVDGLARLRLPRQLVDIMAFMLRYLEVVVDELRRMRIAAASRGFAARHPRHWGVLARAMGALFIRSFERGERVHLAMLARGYRPGGPA